MERLDDEAQWIVLMGFIVSIGIFFLAIIISQSTIVGQTTSEAVLEFPKTEIQDVRSEVIGLAKAWEVTANAGELAKRAAVLEDLRVLAMARKNAVLTVSVDPVTLADDPFNESRITIHFNNGVTEYDEFHKEYIEK
ncbi:MAG: hypothetical protein GKC04_07210 [Methanomicrobiales archaeon]|nr:hypothetical protein [Methanomicrobiales archaeon]